MITSVNKIEKVCLSATGQCWILSHFRELLFPTSKIIHQWFLLLNFLLFIKVNFIFLSSVTKIIIKMKYNTFHESFQKDFSNEPSWKSLVIFYNIYIINSIIYSIINNSRIKLLIIFKESSFLMNKNKFHFSFFCNKNNIKCITSFMNPFKKEFFKRISKITDKYSIIIIRSRIFHGTFFH